MKKWNLVIDVASCTNCHLCTLSAADEYVGNEFPGYTAPMPKHGHRWVDILQKERGQRPMIDLAYVPTMCNHCDDPPCLAASRNGAVTKRADGIVLIDPVRARGQKQIVDACPYGHVWWNEELQLPQSWPFDAHLLDNGWVHTRGDQACPTGAMRSVKLEDADMAQLVAAEGLETLHPEYATQPRVYYKNLWRYATCFIGGTVSVAHGGVVDCLEGARVELQHDGHAVATVLTDNYGDFKFDRLEEGSGAYRVEISAPGLGSRSIDVTLDTSLYLGETRF